VDDEIRRRFGPDLDVDTFWATVERNLRDGWIRLLIVADQLRPAVRRIIEYLNTELETAEVYGLELPCYAEAQGTIVLVPRLVGHIQAAADRKERGVPSPKWTPERLREAYAAASDTALGARQRQVLDWAVDQGFFLDARAKTPTFGLRGKSGDRIFTFMGDGTVYWFAAEKGYPTRAERDQLEVWSNRVDRTRRAATFGSVPLSRSAGRYYG
jgi:hypothetical protein